VSIGTSQAYRLLQIGAGGFEYVGCTKKDLQNYYSDFRNKIKDADAQMFIDNLYTLKELDPNFFFEFEVNDGRLCRVFWADTTSRKNYVHFGDVISFDATYSTNQYDMRFVQRGSARGYKAMPTRKRNKVQVHANARHAKMLDMIGVIVQRKMQPHLKF